jgi:indolepyruvate ferredoxin oxidoreductase
MSVDPSIPFPDLGELTSAIADTTRPDARLFVDASQIAESLLGTHMVANTVMIGAALQSGALPLSVEAVEQAIRLNGTAVDANLAALTWGRVAVAAPEKLPVRVPADGRQARARAEQADAMVARLGVGGKLARVLGVRARELISFQDAAYARRYLDSVSAARRYSRRADVDDTPVIAYASYLYKLMAYKDEYEVARLHLDTAAEAAISEQFGTGSKVYWNLHPPILRAMGMDRKIKLGPWFKPVFRLLVEMRRVRGTMFDVFGRAQVRRVERALIEQYGSMMDDAFALLGEQNAKLVTELAETPDLIRGYEQVKLNNVQVYLARIKDLASILTVNTFDGPLAALTVKAGESGDNQA